MAKLAVAEQALFVPEEDGYEAFKNAAEGEVTLVTAMGDITFELYWRHAPRTCRNFFELAKRGYYDGTLFHRVVPDFVIQGGDPTGTGAGGESIYGPRFEDEIHPGLRHVGAGILSMANNGPNTNGSQFFITLAPCPHLDGKHAIFGRVRSGIAVVKKIACVQVNSHDKSVSNGNNNVSEFQRLSLNSWARQLFYMTIHVTLCVGMVLRPVFDVKVIRSTTAENEDA